jgi:hypothetical protein
MQNKKIEVSEEAKRFIQSFSVSEKEVESALDLLLSWIGEVKHARVDLVIDYDEDVEDDDEEGEPWKTLKVTLCMHDLPFSYRFKILNKLSRDFYALFPEIPTYYAIKCSVSV